MKRFPLCFALGLFLNSIGAGAQESPSPLIEPSPVAWERSEETMFRLPSPANQPGDPLRTWQITAWEAGADLHTVLHLEGMRGGEEVRINGFLLGLIPERRDHWNIHLGPFLQPGTNLLEIRSPKGSGNDFCPEAWLLRINNLHIRDLYIRSYPGPEPGTELLRHHVYVRNEGTTQAERVWVTLRLLAPDGSLLATDSARMDFPLAHKQESEFVFDFEPTGLSAWSPRDPVLHRVIATLTTDSGSETDRVTEWIGTGRGFRTDSLLVFQSDTIPLQLWSPNHPEELYCLNGAQLEEKMRENGCNALPGLPGLPSSLLSLCRSKGFVLLSPGDQAGTSELGSEPRMPGWIGPAPERNP
ncbi:MAG: hypothetical protein R2751_05445 [Bacteroidales bacterium]